MDAKRQSLRTLYDFSDFELGEDFDVSSHSAGISSDFTPLGSIRKLEGLCSVGLYTGERSQKPVLIELSCIAVQINKNPRRTGYRSIDTKPC